MDVSHLLLFGSVGFLLILLTLFLSLRSFPRLLLKVAERFGTGGFWLRSDGRVSCANTILLQWTEGRAPEALLDLMGDTPSGRRLERRLYRTVEGGERFRVRLPCPARPGHFVRLLAIGMGRVRKGKPPALLCLLADVTEETAAEGMMLQAVQRAAVHRQLLSDLEQAKDERDAAEQVLCLMAELDWCRGVDESAYFRFGGQGLEALVVGASLQKLDELMAFARGLPPVIHGSYSPTKELRLVDSPVSQRLESALPPSGYLTLPIRHNGQLLGLFVFGMEAMAQEFEGDLREFCSLVARDVAAVLARMSTERELRERVEDLRQQRSSQEQFLATISNEMRTPLSSILGYSELLLSGLEGSPLREYASSVQHSGRALLGLMEGLTDEESTTSMPVSGLSRADRVFVGAPTLLVVEDNSMLLQWTRLVLENAGAQVEGAASLATARSILQSSSFDAVLLDNGLPDGSGLDLLRWMGSDPRFGPTKVAAYSASALPKDRAAFLAAGAHLFLAKPISGKLLVESLVAALEGEEEMAEEGSDTEGGVEALEQLKQEFVEGFGKGSASGPCFSHR